MLPFQRGESSAWSRKSGRTRLDHIDHDSGDPLRQKERASRVDRHDSIETLGRRAKDIESLLRRDACVVDQQVDSPEALRDCFDHSLVIIENRYISLNRQERGAGFFNSFFDLEYSAVAVLRIPARDCCRRWHSRTAQARYDASPIPRSLRMNALGLRQRLGSAFFSIAAFIRHLRSISDL